MSREVKIEEARLRYTAADIRGLAAAEVKSLDWGYISDSVKDWWKIQLQQDPLEPLTILKARLRDLLEEKLNPEDRHYCDLVGTDPKIAAVCITNIFRIADPRLALIVHETLSTMFHVKDMQYSYEEHKEISVRPEGLEFTDWGRGSGEITPHCDDLYEDIDTGMLSLTVCDDETQTATQLIQLKDILAELTDEDIEQLWRMEATFISGKNVRGRKEVTRPILEISPDSGLSMSLDFRKDPESGDRMLVDDIDKPLIDKLRNIVERCQRTSSVPQTGTFLAVNNHKALHVRPELKLTAPQKERVLSGDPNKPRLLFRSKGPNDSIPLRRMHPQQFTEEAPCRNKADVLFKELIGAKAKSERFLGEEDRSDVRLIASPKSAGRGIFTERESQPPRRRALTGSTDAGYWVSRTDVSSPAEGAGQYR